MFRWLILLPLILTHFTFAQLSFDNPRLGIVISRTSFDQHWGVSQMSAHGWGGIANLAGIPYNCFFVEDLTADTDLSRLQCLIFTQCTYLTDQSYNDLTKLLEKYLSTGGSIIVDGIIGHFDEKTKERKHSSLDKLLALKYSGFSGDPEFRIKVKDNEHFITRDFSRDQYITQHLAGGLNIQSFDDTSTVLLELTDEKESFPFLSVNMNPKNRITIVNDFATWSSAASIFRNEQPRVFYNNYIYNILIEAVYWSLYGSVNKPFPSLQVSNADLTAIVRLDADASGNLNAQIQTINYLIDVAKETGVVPVYAWVSSTAATAGWQDIAPLGKKLESVGGQIGTHSKLHNIDQEMTELRWKEELDEAIATIEFNMADYGYDIGKVNCFINPGNTIRMSDYNQVARRFGFYMTHGFEQDMPIGFGNFTWYNEDQKNFVVLENTPSPDYQWFYDPTWSYTTQQITAYQESIFDHLINTVGRGVIYNQMWHDYSITSQPQYGKDRVMNKSNIAMYDAIKAKFKNSNIYAPEPEDLRNKICIMAQSDYTWSVSDNEINIRLDLSNVGPDSALYYTGGMGIRINNTHKQIRKVTINGDDHYAFSNDVVILPNLNDETADIKITLGNSSPDEPRLTYTSKRITEIEKNKDGLTFSLITQALGKFIIEATDNFILVNADGFKSMSKEQNELEGYVYSNRQVYLKKLSDQVKFSLSTVKISEVAENGNSITLKISTNTGKDKNRLQFSSKKGVQIITFNNEELNVEHDGGIYFISLPQFEGEKELAIHLK